MPRKPAYRKSTTRAPGRGTRTVPGMRRCQTCGLIYTNSAMVCPHCHPYGRVLSFRAPADLHPDSAASTATVLPEYPFQGHDMFGAPAWLPDAAAVITADSALTNMRDPYISPIMRGFFAAVAGYHLRMGMPANLDEIGRWFLATVAAGHA